MKSQTVSWILEESEMMWSWGVAIASWSGGAVRQNLSTSLNKPRPPPALQRFLFWCALFRNFNKVAVSSHSSSTNCPRPAIMSVPLSAEELKVQLVSEEKYLEDRVAHVERNFSALARDLGSMVRKTARLRDKGDTIAKTLQDFASAESGEMKKSLESIAECFSALEDCNHLKIDKMEAKVVKPLLDYETTCRKAREELKSIKNVGEKEVTKQRSLERVRIRDPANRKRLSQFESDLQKVKIERVRATKTAEDYMEGFERKRTQDLKMVLSEYIHAQMTFHARAMELFTAAYQHTHTIKEDEIVEMYQKGLHPRKPQNQATRSRSASASPLHTSLPLDSIAGGHNS